MPHSLIEIGGSGPPIVVLPANGFPPETYIPALTPLFSRYRVVSLPPRGLWEDAGPAPSQPGTWVTLAEDVLEGLRLHGLRPASIVGHSFGGVAALLAAIREPAWFKALALLDPTIPPPRILAEWAEQRRRGETESRSLVRGALTRRNRFSSVEEAFHYWRGKPLFADWSDDVLRRYARAMLRPTGDGDGLELAWPREWEAHYYRSAYTDSWEDLARLDRATPLLVVRGERSDTFLEESAALFAAKVPWATQRIIPGRGHLFPQSAPVETGRILAEWFTARPAT